MTFLILISASALVMGIDTVRRARHDGAGPTQPPLSHVDDPRFRSFSAR